MKIVNYKLKIELWFIALWLFFFFVPSGVSASTNFTTDYRVVYTINEGGTTHADLNIILTNTSAQFYASSYQIQLGFDNIANIKASDRQGR